MSVEDHLRRARGYVALGDEYYQKAVNEILSAKAENPSLSNREIARQIGRDEKWVRNLLKWSQSASRTSVSPYDGKYQHEKKRIITSALADPEQISDDDLLSAVEERGLHAEMALARLNASSMISWSKGC
jgi:hypothetical protein